MVLLTGISSMNWFFKKISQGSNQHVLITSNWEEKVNSQVSDLKKRNWMASRC